MQDIKEYKLKMEAKLNELDRNIESLTLKAKQAGTEAKHSVMKEVDDLRLRAKKVRQRVRSAEDSGQSAWQEVKGGLEGAWGELKSAYDRAVSQLQ